MITITRRLEFDAAHRVLNHESKCSHNHGHRYVVEIEATAPDLDKLGRIIDFSVLKDKIGTWLDQNWDHNTLVYEEDFSLINALANIPGHRLPFICEWNPTAENMANWLLLYLCPKVLTGTDVKVIKVTVHETPNCFAEATYD